MTESLDAQLQRAGYLGPGVGPFGAWTLQRTLRDMLRFLQAGFELELYAPCEHLYMYWYQDILCGMQLQLHKEVTEKANANAKNMAEAAAAAAAAAAAGSSGGKKGRKAAKVKPFRPVVCGSLATHLELLFVRVIAELSRGSCLLLAALSRLNYLPTDEFQFMPLARRFSHRFLPFAALRRPPPLNAEQFEMAWRQIESSPVPHLLKSAQEHFKSAKARLDEPLKADGNIGLTAAQRAEALAFAKVAVANCVTIATLNMRPPPPGSLAKMSFETHAHFVTVAAFQPPKDHTKDKPPAA